MSPGKTEVGYLVVEKLRGIGLGFMLIRKDLPTQDFMTASRIEVIIIFTR